MEIRVFKKYRINKLTIKLCEKEAEYAELIRVVSEVSGNNSYYMNRGIKLAGEMAVLKQKINQLKARNGGGEG